MVQLPAVLARGLTVVVTPLLSLMQDQVQALCALPSGGVPTAYLSSQQTLGETRVRGICFVRVQFSPGFQPDSNS